MPGDGRAFHFIGSALTLDECEEIVLRKAHTFLTRIVGMSANDAARAMSLMGDLCVCQVVDPLKTMRFSVPKALAKGWPGVQAELPFRFDA